MNARSEIEQTLDDELAALRSYLPLSTVAKAIGCHLATIYRWTSYGCRGEKLRYIQRGATRVTTHEWLDEFFERLTDSRSHRDTPQETAPQSAPLRTTVQRKKAVDCAGRKLDEILS